ncbi:hypothetical protein [Streptomyces sp. NPDC006739]|uniref:hypothetical protein n=1 Tax=Streptomyces sp. NPDC006739 TaxID=3364763 RepID=UPI0036806AB7
MGFAASRYLMKHTVAATKARLERTRIIAAANQSAARTVIRALRILAPGTVPVPEPTDSDPQHAAAPTGPPCNRENASDGYHRALAAHNGGSPPLAR